MISTKRHVSFVQYMPKTKKLRTKLWALCESLTGYFFQFQIYTGKADSGAVEHELAHSVVLDLLKDYLKRDLLFILIILYKFKVTAGSGCT